MSDKRATLALPVYNERPRIRSTLAELHDHVHESLPDYTWELVVVDDGSMDDSLDEVVAAAHELSLPIRVVAHERNHGLGGALWTIFQASQGDVIVTVDADLTYSADHIPRLVRTMEETHAAVVVASPYTAGGVTKSVPRSLEVRSRMANRYLEVMTGRQVATFTGIVRAYDGNFARSLPPLRGGANANIAVLHEAWRQRLSVVEIPAELDWTGQGYRRRRHAMLSFKSISESWHVLTQGVRLRRVARGATVVLPAQGTHAAAASPKPRSVPVDLSDRSAVTEEPDPTREPRGS